jgi:hypothetical protein
MDKTKAFFLFIILIIFYIVSKLIFDFLEIPFSYYGIYLYWFTTVVIFIIVLPDKAGKMFY